VTVFVLSALTVVLFLGGWNAPIDLRPVLEAMNIVINPALDPARLGLGLLFVLAIGVPLAILLLTLPIWMLRSDWSFLKSLVVGFLLFNVLAGGATMLWLAIGFEAVMGLIWFMGKTYAFVVTFVWMRGTLPRVRIDQLMGFAWKWLLPASLLNLFVTAAALVTVAELR
jgi:NADH:ubiquinone oxidoreductase subunit H